MRILALHGLGSSSSLLKEQLRPFIQELGPSCHFIFLEGAVTCGRGPAVPLWASPPFYSHATGFSPAEVHQTFQRIDQFTEENGPFDGVLGFSLGAALAMSYILHKQRTQPHGKLPFYFATVFSPIFVASADETQYGGIVDRLLDDEHIAFRSGFPNEDFLSTLKTEDERIFADYTRVVLSMNSTVGNVLPGKSAPTGFFEEPNGVQPASIPRMLHPKLTKDRIGIPTVVVTGAKEAGAISEQSRVAQDLCRASLRWKYQHDGGHDVPFKRSDVQEIVSFMMEAIEEGRELSSLHEYEATANL
ncbi:hypothetical protein MYU51_010509 [Penicillium brevicompactum]